jgi:hypothetical protein
VKTRVSICSPTCLAALTLTLGACHQPRPKCTVAHGTFAATYELVEGKGDCAGLRGEILNVQGYIASMSATNKRPDYDKTSIGIEPASIADLLSVSSGTAMPDARDKPYSFGFFSSAEPNGDDFCIAPKLNVARLRLPALPDIALDECTTVPAQPATDIAYAFSNVRVYVTPDAIGTQLSADLKYTQGTCTATYKVRAVSPAVPCGVETPAPDAGMQDAGAQDAGPPAADAGAPPMCPPPAGPSVADDGACTGSAINSEFALKCDPEILLCVARKEIPSIR